MQAAEGALPIQRVLVRRFLLAVCCGYRILLDHRQGAQARSAGVGTYRAS